MPNFWSSITPRNAHLLIIDNSMAELKELLALLRNRGYQLSLAMGPMQGYRRATAQSVDLILLGMGTGSVDEFAACRLLKADAALAHIPVIFIASNISPQEQLEALHCGAVDCILQPLKPAEVLARVKIHLALAHRRPMHAQQTPLLAAATADSAIAAPALPAPPPSLAHQRTPSHELALLRAAQRIVHADLARVPSLPELAAQLGTYEKRLTRVFLKLTGHTPYDFIRQARLNEARRMLADSLMRIEEVALAVGFSSAANFSTAFRQHFGNTPSAFRRSIQPPSP